MGSPTPANTVPSIWERLRASEELSRKARMMRESAISELVEMGFDPVVIARAAALAFTDPEEDFTELRGVMELLQLADCGVQIETIAMAEAPAFPPKRNDKRKAFDAGKDARSLGLPCRSPYPAGVLDDEWRKGWKDV